MSLEGRTVLITGASQGIGRRLAVHLGRRCGRVIIMARSDTGLRDTAAEIETAGGTSLSYVADLTDTASLVRMADDLGDRSITVDVLIHNAADLTSKPLAETTLDEIDRLVATNVSGPLKLTRLLLPLLAVSPRPSIVTISSLAGYKPNPSQTVYSIAKWAVNGVAQALDAEFGPTVHVMNVALSSVGTAQKTDTGQIPIGRCVELIEQGILRGEHELFMSRRSKWLMRLYGFYPPLARRTRKGA